MRLRRGIGWMLVIALLLAGLPSRTAALTSEELEDQIEQLEEERAEIRKQREALEALRGENLSQMEGLVQEKSLLEQQMNLLYGEIQNTQTQITAYAQLIADQQELLDAAQLRFQELNEKYKLRIRAMEEAGALSWWSVLFQANSFMELLDRMDMIQEIAAADRKRLQELTEQLAQAEQDLQEALEKEEQERIPTVSEEGWMTPVTGYYISSPFGMRMHPILGYERMHNGVDMACPAMTPIYASRSGIVTAAAFQADGAGNYVQLNHGDGYRSIYMHMTYYTVSLGEYVHQGQLIGYVGDTGLSKGNHLHFGISYNGSYVNPMAYL